MNRLLQAAHTIYSVIPFFWLSVTFNAIIFTLWFKSRVILDEFIVGRWEGTLQKDGVDCDPNCVIECILMISKNKDAHDAGYLYYGKINLGTGRYLTQGLDQLDHYDTDRFFVFRREWNPRFKRVFHKCNKHQSANPAIYDFKCHIDRLFFKPTISVRVVHGEKETWVGHWSKR